MDQITNQLIKEKTTAPAYGTLAGELPKESLNEISQQLENMHHTITCDETCKKLDTEAIHWAHNRLLANWAYLFGKAPRKDAMQMMDRLKAMLPIKTGASNDY